MSSYHRITSIIALVALLLIVASFVLLQPAQNPPSTASETKSLEVDVDKQMYILKRLTDQLSKDFDIDIYKTYESEMTTLDDIIKKSKDNLTEIAEILKNCKSRVNSAINSHRSASIRSARNINLYIESLRLNQTKALKDFSDLDRDWDNNFIPIYHPNATDIYFTSIYPNVGPSANIHVILNNNGLKEALHKVVAQSCSSPFRGLPVKETLTEARNRLLWISKEYKRITMGIVPKLSEPEMFSYDLCLIWSRHLKKQQLWRVPIGTLSSDVVMHVFKGFLHRLHYHMNELARYTSQSFR